MTNTQQTDDESCDNKFYSRLFVGFIYIPYMKQNTACFCMPFFTSYKRIYYLYFNGLWNRILIVTSQLIRFISILQFEFDITK